MIQILKYSIDSAIQFIIGIYNIKIEFFSGTQTKIGDLTIAFCIFLLIFALILNILIGSGGDN